MKKTFFFLCALFVMILTGCRNDDEKLPEVAVTATLQELCNRMNTNVSSITTLVKAVNDNDSVTSINPLNEDSAPTGYCVSFVKGPSIKIYLDNVADSRTASTTTTPILSPNVDSDSHYYWTLDGEWLLNGNGQKIGVGDGSNIPQLKIKGDGWYISVDNGSTWRYLGASAENGRDSMFCEVDTSDPDYVTFTLTNDIQFTLARQPGITITFDEKDLITMRPNSTRNIGYTISGKTENLRVEVMWSGNVKAQISDRNSTSGTLTITTGATIDGNDKVMLMAYNSQGRVMKSISFEETALIVTSSTSYKVNAEGGTITINIETNTQYTLSIPEEAKSWISVSASRAIRQENITLDIDPNENASRSATVDIIDNDGYSYASLAITQTCKSIPLSAFPDENFRQYIAEYIDKDHDNEISAEETEKVMVIDVCNKKIISLQGIEYFTYLTELYCYGNQLTSLDLSKNAALTELWCSKNQLTSLDLSKNTALTELLCYDNQLTSLDLNKNEKLTSLYCYGNQLTSLDLSKNTALTKLWCFMNQLTSLDLSKNTALTELSCYENQLTSLDLSENTALTELLCYENQLTSLDLSENTALITLYCYKNQLTSLDLSENTALITLYCFDNELTSLDLSKNIALSKFYCDRNQLTSLDLSNNTALTSLNCCGNQLTSLDVSKNVLLDDLICDNNQLVELNLSQTNMNNGFLSCDMPTLEKLILKKWWVIRYIIPDRHSSYINDNTQIELVD